MIMVGNWHTEAYEGEGWHDTMRGALNARQNEAPEARLLPIAECFDQRSRKNELRQNSSRSHNVLHIEHRSLSSESTCT